MAEVGARLSSCSLSRVVSLKGSKSARSFVALSAVRNPAYFSRYSAACARPRALAQGCRRGVGERGTLRYYFPGSSLKGRFSGKTGTISGVKSVSGRLLSKNGPLYVSMISNGSWGPVGVMRQVLEASDQLSACQPQPL